MSVTLVYFGGRWWKRFRPDWVKGYRPADTLVPVT